MCLPDFSPMHLLILSGNLGKNAEHALTEASFGGCVSLRQCHGHQSRFSKAPQLIEWIAIRRKFIRLPYVVQSGYSNNGCLRTRKAEILLCP